MLLLALVSLLASSLPTTAVAAVNMSTKTTAPCPPVPCGNLSISYPFWLAGAQQPECGYKAFEVACEERKVYLRNFYWRYQVLNIWYDNSSFVLANANLPEDGSYCGPADIGNLSTDLSAAPFKISDKNQELLFLSDCQAQARQLPASWAPVNCSSNDSDSSTLFAWLARKYSPDEILKPLPGNCAVSAFMPVLGYHGASAADYERLLKGGFLLEHNFTSEDCTQLCGWQTGGKCSVNTGEDVLECLCPDGVDGRWFTCGGNSKNRIFIGTGGNSKNRIFIGTVCGVGGSLLIACFFFIWHKRKRRKQTRAPNGLMRIEYPNKCKKISSATERNIEALILLHGSLAPKRYKYSEATKITSSLNNKLGEGGYGKVFKGRLDDGHLVAVKFLHESKGEGEDFVNEVMSIGRTSHVNIVSLFGFCLEGSKRALIYEYMPKGSLDKYIYSENSKAVLGWDKLYMIAIGIAGGLEYLHHSCNTRIVHFDIKPQNILLDEDFHPKIADFGLAKLCHTKESKLSMTGARGTIGFIAPEVHSRTFGIVSTKSDVYSYGMMLLEMVGGRKNVKSFAQISSEKYFPHWIYDHFGQDNGLLACEVTDENEGIAKKMSVIGMWCIQILPLHRPTITKVLEMFERSLDELDMPPRQNFSQILEDPAYNFNAENMSTSSGTETHVSIV